MAAAGTYRKLGRPSACRTLSPRSTSPWRYEGLPKRLVNSRQCIPRFVHERRITETSLIQNLLRTYILISRMTFRDKQEADCAEPQGVADRTLDLLEPEGLQ